MSSATTTSIPLEDAPTVVVIIGRHLELVEHIVRHCLSDVLAVHVQRKEHDARPKRDTPVELPHSRLFLLRSPFQSGIEDMAALVLRVLVELPIVLRNFWVQERIGTALVRLAGHRNIENRRLLVRRM